MVKNAPLSPEEDDTIEEDASHWFTQATTWTCGPAAITMVLADLLDVRMADEYDVTRRAIDLGAISKEGMLPSEIARVMCSFGIPARLVQSHASGLEALIDAGHEIIAMVDADEYHPNDGWGEKDELRKWPHAVRVLRVDTAAQEVILSDSAWTDPMFSQLRIPLAHFVDAWEDFDWLVVMTEVTHADVRRRLYGDGTPADTTRSAEARNAVTTVFLPFSARLSRLLEALRRRAG